MILTDCRYCIDGHVPAGIDPIFGPIYRNCPCTGTCPTCHGLAIFPAAGDHTLEILVNAIYHLGYQVAVCRDCLGITAVHPAEEHPL